MYNNFVDPDFRLSANKVATYYNMSGSLYAKSLRSTLIKKPFTYHFYCFNFDKTPKLYLNTTESILNMC
ncbi:hypothetical protein KUTeg_006904 [Tegillarca granosa]|uniref:Uncharacterized protein n=1 Tax=Tegillarca granosa TaxID=220873 RepID=A0ABQ9FBP5_TEGGR|nr:hypothetical protein KUTeg_006904 [Tegillarca granosa]